MKQWQETSQIVGRIAKVSASGERAALATVVRIAGSSYRRTGAKLLIEPAGGQSGGVSGGCLEADVRETALKVLAEGQPRIRHYDTSTDEDALWGLGLGCNGAIDVFIQAVTPGGLEAMVHIRDLLEGDSEFAISTVLEGQAAGDVVVSTKSGTGLTSTVSGEGERGIGDAARRRLSSLESGCDKVGGVDVFTEIMTPPPRLVIVGAGDDARPLASIGATVGFRVCVIDHRAAFARSDRFPEAEVLVGRFDDPVEEIPFGPNCYVVVMTHSLANDRGWVDRLLRTEVPYVGVLGPQARTEGILEEVSGVASNPRVFGPVGTDIGSDGPEQVAVSIVAEVLSVRARALGHPRLRSRAGHVSGT